MFLAAGVVIGCVVSSFGQVPKLVAYGMAASWILIGFWRVVRLNDRENAAARAPLPGAADRDSNRIVRHVLDGGKIRRFTADDPNEACDNYHEVRMENGEFLVTGFASALLGGDAYMIEALKHPEEWEIVTNAAVSAPLTGTARRNSTGKKQP